MRIGGWLAAAVSVVTVAACSSSSDGGGGGGATGSAGSQGSLAGSGDAGEPASAGASHGSSGSSGAASQAGSGSAGAPASGGGSSSAEWACINSGGVCDCQVPFVPQPAGTPNTCTEAKYDCCYYVHPAGINERCRCMPLDPGGSSCAAIAAAIDGKVQDHCPP